MWFKIFSFFEIIFWNYWFQSFGMISVKTYLLLLFSYFYYCFELIISCLLFLKECSLHTTTCSFCTTSCFRTLPCAKSSPDAILKTGFVLLIMRWSLACYLFVSFLWYNFIYLIWTAHFKASCCLYSSTSHRKGSSESQIFCFPTY